MLLNKQPVRQNNFRIIKLLGYCTKINYTVIILWEKFIGRLFKLTNYVLELFIMTISKVHFSLASKRINRCFKTQFGTEKGGNHFRRFSRCLL